MLKILLRDAMDRYAEKNGEHLTYPLLAERTGIAQSTLESMGSRKGYNTSTKNIEILCRVLGCTPCDLLEYSEEADERELRAEPAAAGESAGQVRGSGA